MTPTDLSLVPVKELIDELMRRTTFLGVVVHSVDDYKGRWQGEKNFRLHFNSNLTVDETSGLLDAVSKYIDMNLC
jgi:hypothetical protein